MAGTLRSSRTVAAATVSTGRVLAVISVVTVAIGVHNIRIIVDDIMHEHCWTRDVLVIAGQSSYFYGVEIFGIRRPLGQTDDVIPAARGRQGQIVQRKCCDLWRRRGLPTVPRRNPTQLVLVV